MSTKLVLKQEIKCVQDHHQQTVIMFEIEAYQT